MNNRWPTAQELADELRRRGSGGLVQQNGGVVRSPVDAVLIDAADLLEHMAHHLTMIADERRFVSPDNVQERRAALGLHRPLAPSLSEDAIRNYVLGELGRPSNA